MCRNMYMSKVVERKIYMNKKRLFTTVFVLLIFIVLIFSLLNKNSEKEKIFDYVVDNEKAILNAVDEINKLSQSIALDYAEQIVNVGNAEINEYVEDVDGLYVEIKGLLGTRRVEIDNENILNILNGKPIANIGIDNGIIIFDCGGKGIAPSSQDYAFYYSPNDEPFAVFGGYIVCEPSKMTKEGNGYKYIDSGYNIFYVEEIKDNLYFCEASF